MAGHQDLKVSAGFYAKSVYKSEDQDEGDRNELTVIDSKETSVRSDGKGVTMQGSAKVLG